MRLLDHFDEAYYERVLGKRTRLHIWVPPVPNDAGVTIGAAYMGAYHAGYGVGAPIEHAFYCGASPTEHDIRAALIASPDIEWTELKSADSPDARGQFADFMAFMTAHDAIFAIFHGAAGTGPRALGHRSILANPCNPTTRENLNAA
jgi:carbamoyltransferase